VLAGVGLVGLASAITACGAGTSSTTPAAGNAATTPAAAGSTAASSAAAGGASSSSGAKALAATSEIPVGSGMIFPGPQVVVTQPTAGEYKAFSAVCTHMGCIVNQISIATGDVVAGPAPRPLPAKQIKVSGSSVFLE
jgi:Rieske Fe-S protein